MSGEGPCYGLRVTWTDALALVALLGACVPDEVVVATETGSSSTTADATESTGEPATETETGPVGETGTETETETGPDPSTETGEPPPDLPDCEDTLIEGAVLIGPDSTPAELALLTCVEEITGDLVVEDTALPDLDFLASLVRVGGHLQLWNNDALIDLGGLAALTEVGGEFDIYGNDALPKLSGLEALESMAGLWIAYNDALISLSGLSGDLHLHALSPDSEEVSIRIYGNEMLPSLDGLAAITSLSVERPLDLRINNHDSLTGDLSGLEPWIGDEHELALVLTDNHLDSLEGLEGLTSVRSIDLLGLGGDYPSLVGLDNLAAVSGTLRIGACICIGGEVNSECETDFGLEVIESLAGLESLETLGELHIFGNEILADIDALAGLVSVEGDLLIEQNPFVSPMAVASLVAGVDVGGLVSTSNNGDGDSPVCGFVPW